MHADTPEWPFVEALLELADALAPTEPGTRLHKLTGYVRALTAATATTAVIIQADGSQVWAASADEDLTSLTGSGTWDSGSPLRDCHRLGQRIPEVPLAHPYARACWPRYTKAARDNGFTAIAAVPVRHRAGVHGALCLLAERPGQLGDTTAHAADALARAAATGLTHHQTLAEQQCLTGQLQNALDHRTVIEQAKGILAERHHIPVPDAFEVLRLTARTRHWRIHDLAQAVVADARGPTRVEQNSKPPH
uniref:ANTAR domain-containing protein n=1 Tax=Streptomyces sp. NBC_00003 TaxID=2903608 RepID=A0AAU2UXJ3_9ACTN